jgi:hypothetical protein
VGADAVSFVERDRSTEEADGGAGLLVLEDFDVGQACGVIDADVDELPAGDADALAVEPGLLLAGAAAGDAVPSAADPPQLLDVDVQELAGVTALVAVRRLGWLQPAELAQPNS